MTIAQPMPARIERHIIDTYRNARIAKHRGLFALAKETAGGCIVELGVWQGRGLLALAFGSACGHGVPVYGVDHWKEMRDPRDESRLYSPKDKDICEDRLKQAGSLARLEGLPWNAELITGDIQEVAAGWDRGPIALIHWDAGLDLAKHYQVWEPYLIPGGVFAIHDTKEQVFGSGRLEETIIEASGASLYMVRKNKA